MYTKTEPNYVTSPRKIISAGITWTDVNILTNMNTSQTGQKVDGWRNVIAAGENATSPFSKDAWKVVEEAPGNAACQWAVKGVLPPKFRQETMTGWIYSRQPFGHLSGNFDKAEAAALKSIYSKIDRARTHMKSLSFFAEFVDVLRQFGSPLHAVLKNYDRFLSPLEKRYWALTGSAKHRSDTWRKIIADTYLEWSFGMVPLISDMRAASEALARYDLEREGVLKPPTLRISARGEETVTSVYTQGISKIPDTYLRYQYAEKLSTLRGVQYICGMRGEPTADYGSNDRLLELYGVDLRKVPEALWEATPWSWLVDYATNVGDIIAAGCTVTSDVKWVSHTVLSRTTRLQQSPIDVADTLAGMDINGRYGTCSSGHAGYSKMVRTTMSRESGSLGLPPLVFEIDLNMGQSANLAAVILSKASKPKPWSPY